MATELAKAYVQIIPSAQGIKGSIAGVLDSEAESAGKSAGNKLSSAMGTALKIGGAAVAAGGAAIAALTKSLVSGAAETAAYGDNIDKMSQKMGLSIQAYQEWDAIMQHSGTSIESMQSSMKTLANAVETGNKAFKKLGMTQDEIAAMSNEDLFAATITALQNVENETERTYLAGQLLGRGATELGALLNTSAEDTEAMRQRVHELGGVMSDEAVKAAAAYQDSLQDMQTAFSSLSRGLLQDFMPGITTIMNGLTEIFNGNSENGIAVVSYGVHKVVTDITNQLPAFLDLGVEILSAIAKALIDNLPRILEAGGKIVGELIAGLIAALPKLIEMAPQLIMAIIKGLVGAWPSIKQAGADLVKVAGDAFKGAVGSATTWGRDLMENFIGGIKAKIQKLRDTVASAAQTVKNFLGFSEPEMGPLSDFHTFAPDMMDLFAEGIYDNLNVIRQAADEAAATTRSAMTAQSVSRIDTSTAARGGADAETIAAAVREALRDMGVYMDGARVGRLVTRTQSNTARAYG